MNNKSVICMYIHSLINTFVVHWLNFTGGLVQLVAHRTLGLGVPGSSLVGAPSMVALSKSYFHTSLCIYEAIPPFSVRRIPAFLDSIRYAEPWYAVRQQKCKWYAYADFYVLQVTNHSIQWHNARKWIELIS